MKEKKYCNLSIGKIISIRKYIDTLKDKEYYKYYFGFEEDNFPDKAFLINNYYMDFTLYDNICFFGIISLVEKNEYSNRLYFDIIALLKQEIKNYKKIYLCCFLDNKIAVNFHKLLVRKLGAERFEDSNYSYTVITNDNI